MTSNGYIYILPSDGINEGGEIQLSGAGNYAGWSLDAYQNNHRTFVRTGSTLANVTYFHALGGTVRMGVNRLDPTFTLDVAGSVNSAGLFVNGLPVVTGSVDLSPANNWSNTKVASVSSNSTARIWANTVIDGTNSEIVYLDLSTSGVTAATYGSPTNIPIVTVDAFGRITSAANVAVQGMDYPYANAIGAASNTWANTVGTAGNNYTNTVGTAGNNYTNAVGIAGNNYASILAANNAVGANAWANTVSTAANNYMLATTASDRDYTNTSTGSANTWANTVGTAGNNYTNAVGTAGNNYASILAANNAVGGNTWANTVGTAGNNYTISVGAASNNYSNSTFVKLTAASQTISGDLAITGNLTLLGNATSISSNNLIVGDSLIYLAANNYSGTDILDIGFLANYANGTGANVHTGLIRDATNKQYYLFQGLDIELFANNTAFTPGANGVVNAVLNADLVTSNLTLGGANAINWINAAYTAANNVGPQIAPAFNTANAAYASVNSNWTVTNTTYSVANAAFNKANTTTGGANVGQTTPAVASLGSLWWNSDLGKLFVYYTDPANTSLWVETSPSAATIEGAIITSYINPLSDITNAAFTTANAAFNAANVKVQVSNTAPTNPTQGSLWWNKDYGRLLVYYTDADSSQWVDTTPSYDASPIYNTANAAYNKANSVTSISLAYAIALGM